MTARVEHQLLDPEGTVQARVWAPEGESPEVAPWMLYKICSHGWSIVAMESSSPGVEVHGYVNWREVAQGLADVMAVVIDVEEFDWQDTAAADDLMERGKQAFENFQVAQMEYALAFPEAPEKEDGEDDDGSAAVGA